MAKVLDCSVEVNEFKLQLCYYAQFWAITPEKSVEHFYPFSYGLNSITAVLL